MLNKLSLSEQVEIALRKEIIEGRVQPGQRINITEYQQLWGISSTPFRDAVRSLEVQGFVIVEPRKGIYVASLDLNMLNEIFAIRIALECMAIELATSLVTQEEAEEAREKYCSIAGRTAEDSFPKLREIDELVHNLARDRCGNVRLQRLINSQLDLIRWVQNAIVQKVPNSYEVALPEHLAIMDAVCDRNSIRASQAMRDHLEATRIRLVNQMLQEQTKP